MRRDRGRVMVEGQISRAVRYFSTIIHMAPLRPAVWSNPSDNVVISSVCLAGTVPV